MYQLIDGFLDVVGIFFIVYFIGSGGLYPIVPAEPPAAAAELPTQ